MGLSTTRVGVKKTEGEILTINGGAQGPISKKGGGATGKGAGEQNTRLVRGLPR